MLNKRSRYAIIEREGRCDVLSADGTHPVWRREGIRRFDRPAIGRCVGADTVAPNSALGTIIQVTMAPKTTPASTDATMTPVLPPLFFTGLPETAMVVVVPARPS